MCCVASKGYLFGFQIQLRVNMRIIACAVVFLHRAKGI